MTIHRLVLVALLSGSACVAVDEPPDAEPEPGAPAQGVTSAQLAIGPAEICDMLPPDGPCSQACDPDALASYVPAGTCAVFRCDLLDGRSISVHACRPGE